MGLHGMCAQLDASGKSLQQVGGYDRVGVDDHDGIGAAVILTSLECDPQRISLAARGKGYALRIAFKTKSG